MKKYLVPLFVVLVCSGAVGQAGAQAFREGEFSAFFGPRQAMKLTITSGSGVVSVLEVPRGVFLNVVASVEKNPGLQGAAGLPCTFRGDLTIRTRRDDEVPRIDGRLEPEFMAKSPLEMKLGNVEVLLEAVGKVDE